MAYVRRPSKVFSYRPYVGTVVNNPVSTTIYPILALTANVRIISIEADVVWAVTQPTPLDIVVVADGTTIVYTVANPVTATPYYASMSAFGTDANQRLDANDYSPQRSFLLESKHCSIGVRITWAVTQPDPLVVRLHYEVL